MYYLYDLYGIIQSSFIINLSNVAVCLNLGCVSGSLVYRVVENK